MEHFGDLMHGFSVALTAENFMYCWIGAVLGTVVGVLPGLGSAATIALLLPVTYAMPPTSGRRRSVIVFRSRRKKVSSG